MQFKMNLRKKYNKMTKIITCKMKMMKVMKKVTKKINKKNMMNK